MLARKFEVIQGEGRSQEAQRRPISGQVSARIVRPQRPTVDAAVAERRDNTLVLAPAVDAEAMSHVWLDLDLDLRTVRVLAQVVGHNGAGTHLRIRHAWPKDQELLDRLAV